MPTFRDLLQAIQAKQDPDALIEQAAFEAVTALAKGPSGQEFWPVYFFHGVRACVKRGGHQLLLSFYHAEEGNDQIYQEGLYKGTLEGLRWLAEHEKSEALTEFAQLALKTRQRLPRFQEVFADSLVDVVAGLITDRQFDKAVLLAQAIHGNNTLTEAFWIGVNNGAGVLLLDDDLEALTLLFKKMHLVRSEQFAQALEATPAGTVSDAEALKMGAGAAAMGLIRQDEPEEVLEIFEACKDNRIIQEGLALGVKEEATLKLDQEDLNGYVVLADAIKNAPMLRDAFAETLDTALPMICQEDEPPYHDPFVVLSTIAEDLKSVSPLWMNKIEAQLAEHEAMTQSPSLLGFDRRKGPKLQA